MNEANLTPIGIFLGDSSGANLLVALNAPAPVDGIAFILQAITDQLIKRKFISSGSYLLWADEKEIAREIADDEHEDFYEIYPDELAGLAKVDYSSLDELVELILDGYAEEYGKTISADFRAEVMRDWQARQLDKELELQAAASIRSGELVYICRFFGDSPVLHPPVKFNPDYHDARQVTVASMVPDKPSGKFVSYPLSPSRNELGKFWGHFEDTPAKDVYFRANSMKELKKKAAIYEVALGRTEAK